LSQQQQQQVQPAQQQQQQQVPPAAAAHQQQPHAPVQGLQPPMAGTAQQVQQQQAGQHNSAVRAATADAQAQQLLQQQAACQPDAARPAEAGAQALSGNKSKRRKVAVKESSLNALKQGKLCINEHCYEDPETRKQRTRLGSA
jgi:hypothetical protein